MDISSLSATTQPLTAPGSTPRDAAESDSERSEDRTSRSNTSGAEASSNPSSESAPTESARPVEQTNQSSDAQNNPDPNQRQGRFIDEFV